MPEQRQTSETCTRLQVHEFKALESHLHFSDRSQLGVSVATQYKKTPEDVGDLWYFMAALAKELVAESQDASYGDLSHLATQMIQ